MPISWSPTVSGNVICIVPRMPFLTACRILGYLSRPLLSVWMLRVLGTWIMSGFLCVILSSSIALVPSDTTCWDLCPYPWSLPATWDNYIQTALLTFSLGIPQTPRSASCSYSLPSKPVAPPQAVPVLKQHHLSFRCPTWVCLSPLSLCPIHSRCCLFCPQSPPQTNSSTSITAHLFFWPTCFVLFLR